MVSAFAKIAGLILSVLGVISFVAGMSNTILFSNLFQMPLLQSLSLLLTGLMLISSGFSRNGMTCRQTVLAIASLYGFLAVAGFLLPESLLPSLSNSLENNVLNLTISVSCFMFGWPGDQVMAKR